jgi:dephospho-CoA kinase
VGGIAAGKTTVASQFAGRGICHVDADFHARAASKDPAVVDEVAQQIGPQFVADGKLDRQALGEHVFRDPKAKAKLEQIVHPRVRLRILGELDEAKASGTSVLLDVPLLFEAGLVEWCDTVVFVHASDDTRSARAKTRGWPSDELARREANQMPLDEKRGRSQHVINNDGDLKQTAQAVNELLNELGSDA